jgi:hypothetical protein
MVQLFSRPIFGAFTILAAIPFALGAALSNNVQELNTPQYPRQYAASCTTEHRAVIEQEMKLGRVFTRHLSTNLASKAGDYVKMFFPITDSTANDVYGRIESAYKRVSEMLDDKSSPYPLTIDCPAESPEGCVTDSHGSVLGWIEHGTALLHLCPLWFRGAKASFEKKSSCRVAGPAHGGPFTLADLVLYSRQEHSSGASILIHELMHTAYGMTGRTDITFAQVMTELDQRFFDGNRTRAAHYPALSAREDNKLNAEAEVPTDGIGAGYYCFGPENSAALAAGTFTPPQVPGEQPLCPRPEDPNQEGVCRAELAFYNAANWQWLAEAVMHSIRCQRR